MTECTAHGNNKYYSMKILFDLSIYVHAGLPCEMYFLL